DWYSCGRGLGRQGRHLATDRNDDGHFPTHEIGRKPRQPIVLTLSPPIVEGDVLTFNKAFFVESLANDRNERSVDVRRTAAEQSNHRKRTLLRPCCERPRDRCAADERDELATAAHSITSSASESKLSEIVTPSAFAVFKLITNWNLTVSITGRSAGLTPLSTRPVYTPTRRYASEASTP